MSLMRPTASQRPPTVRSAAFRKFALSLAKAFSIGLRSYVAFQMAEVAIPRRMFQEILRLIAELRPQPPPAPA